MKYKSFKEFRGKEVEILLDGRSEGIRGGSKSLEVIAQVSQKQDLVSDFLKVDSFTYVMGEGMCADSRVRGKGEIQKKYIIGIFEK